MVSRFAALAALALLFLPCSEGAINLRSSLRGESLARDVSSGSGSGGSSEVEARSEFQVKSKAEVMAEMTVEKALQKFMEMDHSKSNMTLVKMIQDKFEGKASNAPTGYSAVDSARDMLNEMMDAAIMKKELESVKCHEFEIKQLKILRDLEQDIAFVNSEASGARAEVLRAEEVIHIVEEVKLPTNRRELVEHNSVCDVNIASLKQQLSIVLADIEVMKNILGMVCADFVTTPAPATAPALLQMEGSSDEEDGAIVKCVSCMTGRQIAWMRHSRMQPMLSALRSQVAKEYLQKNLLSEFDATAREVPASVRSIMLQQGELGQNLPDTGIEIPALGSRFNISEPVYSAPGSCNEQMIGENGSTYRGCQEKTLTGKTCQKWDLQTPHKHDTTAENFPDAGLGDHNYCRNPNHEDTIWCYTQDAGVEWEYCEPLIALKAPTGVSKHECVEANMCKLNKPDCGKLRDRFLVIMAGIIDKKKELSTSLDMLERSCSEVKESYEKTISTLEGQLKEEQTNFASATKSMTENQQQSGLSNEQHGELDGEYHKEMTSCCDNKNAFTGEICALEKIRGELYRLEGLNVFITDCEVSDWVDEECSASCAGGDQQRTRSIIVHPINGTQCPPLKMERSCNEEGCPVDCKLEEWGGWSDCSAECGGGVMTRSRGKTVEPLNNGEPCEKQEEEKGCHGESCNQPCVLGEWGQWSMCSKLCDTGSRERTKAVTVPATGQGACDPVEAPTRLHFEDCNEHSCQSLIEPGHTTLECNEMLDLIVLLDGSGSLGEIGWQKSTSAVKKFIAAMKGGGTGINAGLILFSGPAEWSDFESCTGSNPNESPDPAVCGVQWVKHMTGDIADLETAAESLVWPRRTTLTSLALAEAANELRNGRQDAPSVVMVITDGKPLSPLNTGKAADELKKMARLIWVPVGQDVKDSIEDMRKWASQPADNNMLEIDSFSALDTPATINSMISEFCTQMA